MSAYDVYSYGVVASSTLHFIRRAFPDTEGYAETDNVNYMTGGVATKSSIVLCCLGCRVKLNGNWLSASGAGKRTKSSPDGYNFAREDS